MGPLPMTMLPGDLWVNVWGGGKEDSGKSVKERSVGGVALENQKSLEGDGIIVTAGAYWDLQAGGWTAQETETQDTGEEGTSTRDLAETIAGSGMLRALGLLGRGSLRTRV